MDLVTLPFPASLLNFLSEADPTPESLPHVLPFFKNSILVLAVRGPHVAAHGLSSFRQQRLPCQGAGLLVAVASAVAEHGLQGVGL